MSNPVIRILKPSHRTRCRFSVYAAAFVLAASAIVMHSSGVYADESGVSMSFDGSEFHGATFNDVDLAKHDFRELSVPTAGRQKQRRFVLKAELLGRKEAGTQTLARKIFQKEEVNAPIKELAGDWVPGKIDLAANGAFGIEPFNGTPVPYDLNGHVDAQRGKP